MSDDDFDIALDEVVTPMDRAYIEGSIYTVLDRLGVDRSQWDNGYGMHGFIRGTAIVLAGVSVLTSYIARGQFMQTASLQWGRLKAHYDYDVDYIPASLAQGLITLTNTGAGVYTYDTDEFIVGSDANRKNYRVSQAFTLNAHSMLTLPILALEAGTASNASPGTITTPVTPISSDVQITNPRSVAGTDDESRDALLVRTMQSIALRSPANPYGAYEAIVTAAHRDDGTPIGVTRAVAIPDGFGRVDVYVASATGGIADADDLAVLNRTAHENVEPLSVRAVVSSAVQVAIPLIASVYHTGFLTNAEVQAKCGAAILAFAGRQKIGGERNVTSSGVVYRDALIIALGSADPSIYHVALTAPATDVTIARNAFPVFGPVAIAVTP